MTILSPSDENKMCFSSLFETDFDYTKATPTPKSKVGVTVKPTGASVGSRDVFSSECGAKGIMDLIPGIPNPEVTENFKGILNRLEYMGYENGLTMQAVPYDFRLTSLLDPLSSYYAKIIEELSKMVNKKVIIVSHSMANLRTTHMLWGQTQTWKDTYIQSQLAIAPPYLGTGLVTQIMTCGTDEYSFPLHLGIDLATYKRTLLNFSSFFQMLPNQVYETQKNTPWMQKVMQRINYENN